MLRSENGSPDGKTVIRYHAGREVDLPDNLVKAFCDDMAPPAAVRIDAKMVGAAPENKAILGAPVNKRRRGRPRKVRI